MRIAELSEQSGAPVATIKFYLREGLLAAGQRSKPTQASYDATHLRRLRLIQALREVGGLSLARIRVLTDAIDDDRLPTHDMLGLAANEVSPEVSADPDDPAVAASQARIERLVADRGWALSADNPGWRTAVRVLANFEQVGAGELLEVLDSYAQAAEIVAEADLGTVLNGPDPASRVETVVVGTVLGDSLFAALRRMAQESMSRKFFPPSGE